MWEAINNSFLFDEIVNGADLLVWVLFTAGLFWATSSDRTRKE